MYSRQGSTVTVTVQHGRCATEGDEVEMKSKRPISCCWNCGTPLECLGFFSGDTVLWERVQRECPWLVKELQKKLPRRIWPIPTHNEGEYLGRACSRGCAQSVIEAEHRGDNAAAHLVLRAMDCPVSEPGTSNNKLLLHKYGGVLNNFFSLDSSSNLSPQCADAMFAFRILPHQEQRKKYTGIYRPEPEAKPESELANKHEPELVGKPESELVGESEPELVGEHDPQLTGEPDPQLTNEPNSKPEQESAHEPELQEQLESESDLEFGPEPEPEPKPEPRSKSKVFSFQKRRAKKGKPTSKKKKPKRSTFQTFKF